MPPTLRALVDSTDLGLSVLVGGDGLDRELVWVFAGAPSDPARQLEGGELVLANERELAAIGGYRDAVQHLSAAGAAGLGYQLAHAQSAIPDELLSVARQVQLPLVTVPAEQTVASIGRCLIRMLAQEEQKALHVALRAQADLARAALSPRASRMVADRLSRALGCWVLLLDQAGELRVAVPDTARKHHARVRTDLARLGGESRADSLSTTLPGESAVVMPLGVDHRVRGFLALGRPQGWGDTELALAKMAATLLAINLQGVYGRHHAKRRQRLATLHLVIEGYAAQAATLSEIMNNPYPEGPVRIALLGAPRGHERELLEAAEDDHALQSVSALVAEWEPGRVAVLLPEAEGDIRTLEGVLRAVPHGRGAVSDPAPAEEIPAGWRRVRSVFQAAGGTAGKLVVAYDVATAGLLGYLTHPGTPGWADSQLAPLERHARKSKVDLVDTLRTFLANNGHADASAAALGIHRHTLRYRMGKVAEVLERDLDDPTVRAELWIALQLRELG